MNKYLFRNVTKKSSVVILIFCLFLIILNIIYILFFEKTKINDTSILIENSYVINNIPEPRYSKNITRTPKAADYNYYQDQDIIESINLNTSLITYLKDNKIYTREIVKNYLLGTESVIAKVLPDVADYTITQDKKFIVYSYVTEKLKKGGKFGGGGKAHNVNLVNIETGETKTIFNYDPKIGQIITLTASPYKNIIFIGTDYKQLFLYDINSDKLIDITYTEDEGNLDRDTLCIGYQVFDQSPDLSHILLRSYCYEGTNYYLYNINTKERTNIGHYYVSGPRVKKFIEDGSILIENYNDGAILNIGKYNYQNQLVQELPLPKIDDIGDKNLKKIYYKYIDRDENIREYYLTSEKEIIDSKDDSSILIKNNQFLGASISLVKVFN